MTGPHWNGCWSAHVECAVKEIERLRAERDRLQRGLDNANRSNNKLICRIKELERAMVK